MKTPSKQIARRIEELSPLPGVRLLVAPTEAKDLVTIEGSFLGGYSHSPASNPLLASLVVHMLEEGTLRKSKSAIHEELERTGTELEFTPDTYRVNFTISCLKEHIETVIRLLALEIREPKFGEKEFARVKKQVLTDLEHESNDTRADSHTRLRQKLFPTGHPNHRLLPEEKARFVGAASIEELVQFHTSHYGLGSMIMAAAGDVPTDRLVRSIADHFGSFRTSPLVPPPHTHPRLPRDASSTFTTIEDKTSVDMHIGQNLPLTYSHPDYYALLGGLFILGGSARARLMANVREKQGLTYGIYATLGGMNYGDEGYWYTWATFAPSVFRKGLEATLEQIEKFAKHGVTEAEVAQKKETVAGLYKVGLATTKGLTTTILTNAELERPISFIDDYPSIIESISRGDVNRAIKKYLDPATLSITAAGAIDQEGKPLG